MNFSALTNIFGKINRMLMVIMPMIGIILNISSRIQIYDEEGLGKKQSIAEINDIA